MKNDSHFWSYLIQFFLEWEMFQTNVLERIKTRILFSITPPPLFFNHAVYEMWETIVDLGRTHDDMTHAHCIPKVTNTLRECNTCCFSTTMATRTRLNITVYVHCLSCYNKDGVCLLRGTNGIFKVVPIKISVVLFGPTAKAQVIPKVHVGSACFSKLI
jgi:hypothetical protein